MGKIEQGILGGFSGKVGPVVGYIRKGYAGIRAYRRHRGPSTVEQQRIQLRFQKLTEMANPFASAYRTGLGKSAKGKDLSTYNAFIEKNFAAVSATPGLTTTVDYSKMILSEGKLPPVLFSRPDLTTPQTVAATFQSMLQVDETSGQDQVFLFVYCPSMDMGVMSAPAERSTERVSATVPAAWNGLEVHVWGFVMGNAPINRGIPSNSTYLGSGEIG